MDFTTMDISTISTGVTEDGARYLELFLKEYQSIFSETVNPSCSKCLTTYLSRYKQHYQMKNINDQSGGYKLQAKYEGIPLEFGSQTFVTNANITPELAKKLLKHENGERYFETMPSDKTTANTDKAPAKTKASTTTSGKAKKAEKEVLKEEIEVIDEENIVIEDNKE